MSTNDRVLLFKNPAGGAKYQQAILNIFCAPPNVVVKITTYNKQWISDEILNNPKALENRYALVVCVDAEQDTERKWWIKNFYPIREVKIRVAEMQGEYLELSIEVLGFVRCNNYAKYTQNLKTEINLLPPNEKSYISYDTIRDLQIVNYSDNEPQNYETAWQSLATTLANLKIFDKVAFYTVTRIEDRTSKKKVDFEKNDQGKKSSFAYKFFENKKYSLVLSHIFPLAGRKGKLDRLDLNVVLPKDIDREKEDKIEICGHQGHQNIDVNVSSLSSSNYCTVDIKPADPAVKYAPILSIPVKLSPTLFWQRYWKRTLLLIPAGILAFLYAYAQLIQSYKDTEGFPPIEKLFTSSPEAIGAALSAILLIIIPIIVSQILKGKKE